MARRQPGRIRQHLDHHVAGGQPFQVRLALGGVGGKPPLQSSRIGIRFELSIAADEFENFHQRNPDLRILRGQIENLAELLVRSDELKLRIEHCDALPDVIERGLQHEVQRRVGVVEQFQRGLG